VVNIASSIAGNYDATDLEFERRPYDGVKAYSQSKQAIRMLTWGHAERFAGSGVTVNAVAPGFVKTNLNRDGRGMATMFINLSAKLFAVSPAKGADTPLWAITDQSLDGVTSKYFEKRAQKDGGFADPEAVADLMRRCEDFTRASTGGAVT
jgi:NAD(P)-dependent dehydrogenase (short-subunit alcohol dehydrogenase family)